MSVLLHFVAFHWADIQVHTPSLRNLNVIHAELHEASTQNLAFDLPDNSPKQASHILPTTARQDMPAIDAAKNILAAAPIAQRVPDTAIDTAPQGQTTLHYNINLPPSAELSYDVLNIRKGVPFNGKGAIHWQSDGSHYSISGTTELAESTTRSFQSDGIIDALGIAPLLYTEKSGNKSVTNTHFQRERNIISFSSSTASYPRQGGEQDRASIIWQLAGIGRGDPEKLNPDTDIDIFVAGVRDGESWHIHVLGEEGIETATGTIKTWHLVRMPRAGTYDQRIDLWLAPQQAWYPIKLRYTQVNGDSLDMSLSDINTSVTTH